MWLLAVRFAPKASAFKRKTVSVSQDCSYGLIEEAARPQPMWPLPGYWIPANIQNKCQLFSLCKASRLSLIFPENWKSRDDDDDVQHKNVEQMCLFTYPNLVRSVDHRAEFSCIVHLCSGVQLGRLWGLSSGLPMAIVYSRKFRKWIHFCFSGKGSITCDCKQLSLDFNMWLCSICSKEFFKHDVAESPWLKILVILISVICQSGNNNKVMGVR